MKPAVLAALALAALAPFTLYAQRSARPPARPPATAPARPAAPAASRIERAVPFAVGETLTYDVSWSTFLTAGTVVTTVIEKKPSFNSTAYYIVAEGRPAPLVARLFALYYKLDTLLDSYTLLAQRGTTYSEEGARHVLRTTRFDRAARKVFFESKSDTTVEAEFPASPLTQDALSAIYWLRAVAFKAGDRITLPVSDGGVTFEAQFQIGAPERVRTGMGERLAWHVNVSVVDDTRQPVGRNVAVWLSDDRQRVPVKLQADLPVGSFGLTLREARSDQPLR